MQDNAENEDTTEMYSYAVGLVGDMDFDGDVDWFDFGLFAAYYGQNV